MIWRGLSILTILSSCVLSLPLAPSQLENADVQVMKCIIEALADELSRPHSNPVSQECLETLREDDRLVSVLRHHNFLKELQEIALKGVQERAQLQRGEDTSHSTTPSPQPTSDVSDRSMLEALGGPGERSILSPKRRTGHEGHEEEKDDSSEDGEPQEDNNTITEEVQAKRENDERPGSHISDPENELSERKTEKRDEEESDLNSEEKPEEEHMAKGKKGSRPGEKKDAHRNKSKEMKSDGEEKEKRSVFSSHKQQQNQQGEGEEEEEEGETKRGGIESVRRWTKRGHVLALKKKAVKKDLPQHTSQETEVPHHSKEVSDEMEEKTKRNWQRSPEEKELRMIARSGPEERRGSEEEGSAIRKSEEPEIESLAAIESELENVAQKLHELRRG